MFGLCCAALLAAPLIARADDIPPCPAPAGVTSLAMDHTPAAVLKVFGPMARPGQPFNATDVVSPDSHYLGRRFILYWTRGPRWVIAFEQGGIAYNDEAVAFQVVGGKLTKIGDKEAEPPTICATVHALIGR